LSIAIPVRVIKIIARSVHRIFGEAISLYERISVKLGFERINVLVSELFKIHFIRLYLVTIISTMFLYVKKIETVLLKVFTIIHLRLFISLSTVDKLLIKFIGNEINPVLSYIRIKLTLLEDIIVSIFTRIYFKLVETALTLDRLLLEHFGKEVISILSSIKSELRLLDHIMISILSVFHLKLDMIISLIDRFVLKLIGNEIVSIVHIIRVKIALIQHIVFSLFAQVYLNLIAAVPSIDKSMFKVLWKETTSLAPFITSKLLSFEHVILNEIVTIYARFKRTVSLSDVLYRIRMKTREIVEVSGVLIKHINLREVPITLSDKISKIVTIFPKTIYTSDSLYYEMYPYVYSLDIVEGYPSKTFPSLDITSTEVKTYGEVTIS